MERSKIPPSAGVVTTGCPYDCGGGCLLQVSVENGELKRIGPDETGPDSFDNPQLRPCIRGISQRQRVYHPDRLRYPMKRVGGRGEGQWQRISWEEALDTVAREMLRVKEKYGCQAILNLSGTGNTDGRLYNIGSLSRRLLYMFGGCTESSTIISFHGAIYGSRRTFGYSPSEDDRRDLPKSRLIIMWGDNPAEPVGATNTSWYLAQAKEAGARFIFVDPIFTESAAALADQWLPIRPGTDTALMVALAYVMIREELYDKAFLDRYTFGFEKFRDYCLGAEDDTPKTPQWAEAITGVPAADIVALARDYATLKPAALRAGWAPGRTAFGEQFHRAAIALACMTGNVGRPGGGAGVWLPDGFGGSARFGLHTLEVDNNPARKWFPMWQWPDAVLQGTAGGFPSDIRLIFALGSNHLNQMADTNRGVQAMKKVDFVVVADQFLTPQARYADILLAADTYFEREDITVPHGTGNYVIYSHQALEPVHADCRSDLWICQELARRLGLPSFLDREPEAWLRDVASHSPQVKDFAELRAKGVVKFTPREAEVPFAEFIADPAKTPLPTPSGKIELYSQDMARRGRPDLLPPIPKYIDAWEGPHHPLAQKYPLLLVTAHSRKRANSTFDNIPWLRELEPHTVWLNPADARARSIQDGDLVRVYNDIGTVLIPAKVTERIMPGVVNIYQGAWYAPDERGIDRGGCVNTLCKTTVSPAGAAATNAVLVQVEKE